MCLRLVASWGKHSQKYSQLEEGAKEVPEKERRIHYIHRADQWAGENTASLGKGKRWLLATFQLPDLRKGKVRPKQRTPTHHGRGMCMMLFTCFKNGCLCFLWSARGQEANFSSNTKHLWGEGEKRKTKACIMTGTYWRPGEEGKGNLRGTWGNSSSLYQGN